MLIFKNFLLASFQAVLWAKTELLEISQADRQRALDSSRMAIVDASLALNLHAY